MVFTLDDLDQNALTELARLEKFIGQKYLLAKKFAEGIRYIDLQLRVLRKRKPLKVFRVFESELLRQKSDMLCELAKYDKALRILDILLKRRSVSERDKISILQAMAIIYEKKGVNVKALSAYRQALRRAVKRKSPGSVASLLDSMMKINKGVSFHLTDREKDLLSAFCHSTNEHVPDFESNKEMHEFSERLFRKHYTMRN